jgi:hypothetical protein
MMGDPGASWLQPSVLSPLVNAGLVVRAAWIGYLASKKRKISDISKVQALISGVPPHVLSFTDSSVRTSPWNIRSLRWAIILPMIGITTFSFFSIGVTRISMLQHFIVIPSLLEGWFRKDLDMLSELIVPFDQGPIARVRKHEFRPLDGSRRRFVVKNE